MLLDDDVLHHAKCVNISALESCFVADVVFFLTRFESHINFTPPDLDQVQGEFVDLQLLSEQDIPKHVWDEAQKEDR